MSDVAGKGRQSLTWTDDVRDARRDLLLNAAVAAFAEKGLSGASMRAIASKAGCTTGAIYPIFKSKEAIYAALLSQSLAALDGAVEDAINVADTHNQAVRNGCAAFLAYYSDHPFEINLGLYAFQGVSRGGTGSDSDDELNSALLKVLRRIEVNLAECDGYTDSAAEDEVALLFSQMIGSLVLLLSGRLKLLERDPHQLLDTLLARMLPASNQ